MWAPHTKPDSAVPASYCASNSASEGGGTSSADQVAIAACCSIWRFCIGAGVVAHASGLEASSCSAAAWVAAASTVVSLAARSTSRTRVRIHVLSRSRAVSPDSSSASSGSAPGVAATSSSLNSSCDSSKSATRAAESLSENVEHPVAVAARRRIGTATARRLTPAEPTGRHRGSTRGGSRRGTSPDPCRVRSG